MEEIKDLKIETAAHIFPKFMCMHWIVFDSCMHSFFCANRRGQVVRPTAWLGALGWTSLQGWSAWASFNYCKTRAPVIPALYIYIYIYIYASEEASCSTSSPETNGTTHALLARNVAPNSLLLHTNGFLQSPPVFQGCMVDGWLN
jgi:hypothetical protein